MSDAGTHTHPASRRRRSDDGFSMIELVVSMFVSTLVIGALALLFVNSSDSSLSSQRAYSALSVLQQQIEKIRQTVDQYGFSALALTSAPGAASASPLPVNPPDPNDFVSGSGCAMSFQVLSNYNLTTEAFPSGSSIADSPESLLVNGCTVSGNAISGGQLTPVQYIDTATGTSYSSSANVPASDPYATVYTYVTQTTTVGCNTSLGSCTGDARRVILAAVLNSQATDVGSNYPTYSTTVFANPAASNQPTKASGLSIVGLIS